MELYIFLGVGDKSQQVNKQTQRTLDSDSVTIKALQSSPKFPRARGIQMTGMRRWGMVSRGHPWMQVAETRLRGKGSLGSDTPGGLRSKSHQGSLTILSLSRAISVLSCLCC